MIHYLKKLKIILHYKVFIILFIALLYVYLVISNNLFQSKYYEETKQLQGTVTSIKIDGDKVSIVLKTKEKVLVNYYLQDEKELDIFKQIKLGYKIKVIGELNKPNQNTNFHLFNYRNYLLSKKIYYVINASQIDIISKQTNLFYSIKNFFIEIINKRKTSSYLKTFLLGNNEDISEAVISSFQNNGISHLFALSGMHVTIFSSILLFLFSFIVKNKKIDFFIVALLLIIYMFLTGLSPSIIRAILFFILINLNKSFNLNIRTINLFIFLLSIALIINPYNIYNNGFLFSYTISFYLIIFNKIINRYQNYFIKLLVTSLISFLVSIPIIINNYHSINIISFFFFFFYVPFVSFILFPLSIITFICPIFDSLLKIMINILETTSLFLSQHNLFIINLRTISLYIILFYYIVITFILIMFQKRKYLFSILFIIVIIVHSNSNYLDNHYYITFLDVGQGDSILIQYPHNQGNVLIDTGGKINYEKEEWRQRKKDYNLSNDTIIPFLQANGIKRLHYLIITHGDYDHMGEAINLVNNFEVEKVIFNCGEFNDLEKELIKVLDKKKIKYYSCIKELNIDKNKLYFLQTKEYDNENDNSNVIYTELNGYNFMFMGDAGVDKEKDILEKYNLSNIDVLKVGHHGSKTSSSKVFIDEINPKYSIISVGKNNRYGHPNKEVLNSLEQSKIYRTDQDGSIMLKIKNNKLKIETCSP